MRKKILFIAFLLSAVFFVQCRAKEDKRHETDDSIKTEIAKEATVIKDTTNVSEDGEQPDTPQIAQREPHKGFVYVKDLIPDLIEDLRYFTTNNFMGVKVDGYEANVAILTKQAAEKLKEAADELRKMGYVIKIYDAYRPQCAVDHFVRWAKTSDQRNKKDYYPTLAKNSLFPTYIARKSGHSKGSTIDMTICHKETGKEVDMGEHFDYFGPPSHPSFVGKYIGGGEITPQHKKNRMMLREVMVRHGFKPYDSEWWHFTLRNEPYPTTFFEFHVK